MQLRRLITPMFVLATFLAVGCGEATVGAAQRLDARQSDIVETMALRAFEKERLDREAVSNRDFAAMRSSDGDIGLTGTLQYRDSGFQIVTDANGIARRLAARS